MSNTVDSKTVEMKFDNSNFEKNVRHTMSTLGKLKKALKLDGASAGLDELEKAAKKNGFGKELGKNTDEAGKKFKIFEQIAVGALRKIGEKAADAGLKLAKSMSIDQVEKGWNKYAEKTTAVQTIMANLRDESTKFMDNYQKMAYVDSRLEKLMWFSDETSYSFSEMTSSLGKFIAAGANLDESVTAIQGIATWAAEAGQRNQGAARAMYNISQALSLGAMTTIDWKSIENANMATAQFKELAIQTAVTMGKLKKGQVTVEGFRNSLQKKWFDKEVMMKTFEIYGAAADTIKNYAEVNKTTASEAMKIFRSQDKELIKQYALDNKITENKALQILKEKNKLFSETVGFKAFEAAQEAKTFGEVVEATSDAVSTKWMRIFENIFGDYEHAKVLWTDLANDMWDIFASPLDTINDIMTLWNRGFIEGGAKNADQIAFEAGQMDKLGGASKYVTEQTANLAVANDSARFSIEQLDDGTKWLVQTYKDASGKIKKNAKQIYDSDKDVLSGRTALLEGFKNIFDATIHDVYDENGNLEQMSFFGSLKRGLLEALFGTSELKDVVAIASKKLWEFSSKFRDLTAKMRPSAETSEKLKNGFKGFFNIIKTGLKFIKALIKPLKNLFSVYSKKEGQKGLLDYADSFAEWTDKFSKFLEENKIFENISTTITNKIDELKKGFGDLKKTLAESKIGKFFTNLKNNVTDFFKKHDTGNVFTSISNFITNIRKQIEEIKGDTLPKELTPFQKFYLKITGIFGWLKNFFAGLLPFFRSVGSAVQQAFVYIGGIFSGKGRGSSGASISKLSPIWEGIKSFFSGVVEFFQEMAPTIKSVGEWLGKAFGTIGKVLSRLFRDHDLVDVLEMIYKGNFLHSLTALNKELTGTAGSAGGLFKSGGGVLDSISDFIKTITGKEQQRKGILQTIAEDLGAVRDVLKSYQSEIRSRTLIDVAFGIGLLVASVYVLTKLADDKDKLDLAIKALRMIAFIFAGLLIVVNLIGYIKSRIGSEKEELNVFQKLETMFSGILESTILGNDASAKFVKYALGIALIALAFSKISKSLKDFTAGVSELGKATSSTDFQHGLIALGVIVLAIAALQLLSKIGKRPGSLSMIISVAVFIFLIKRLKSLVDSISDVGANINFVNFGLGLTVLGLLLAYMAIFNGVNTIGGGTKVVSMALSILLMLVLVHAVKSVAEALTQLSKGTNPRRLKQAGRSISLVLGVMLGILTLVSLMAGSKIKIGKGPVNFKFNGTVGVIVGTLGFIAACAGIYLMAMAIEKIASLGLSSEEISTVESLIKHLTRTIGWIVGLLGAIGGLNVGGKVGTVVFGFSGTLGVPVGALSFVAACAGVYIIAMAIEKVASLGLTPEQITNVESLIKHLTRTVGWTVGLLGALAGLNVGAVAGPVLVGFSGTLGVPVGALSFVAACQGVYIIAEALEKVASIQATSEEIDRASGILESITKTVRRTVSLVGIIAGINIGIPLVAGFSGTIGVPVGALSFVAACQGVYVIAEALEKVASIHADPGNLESAGSVLETVTKVVNRSLLSLGALAGLNIDTLAIDYSGVEGVSKAADSFVTASEGIIKISEAMAILSRIGENGISDKLIDQIGSVIDKVTSVFTLKIKDAFLDSDDMAKKAEAFGTVTNSVGAIFEFIRSFAYLNVGLGDSEKAVDMLNSITSKISDFLKTKLAKNANDNAWAFSMIASSMTELITAISSIDHISINEDFGSNLMSGIQTFINEINDSYTSSIENSRQTVYNAAMNLTSEVQRPMLSIVSEASRWGKDLVYTFAKSMIDNSERLASASSYLARVIKDILGFSEPKKGPLSDFHTYAPDMINLWCKGIRDNIGSVKSSTMDVANTMYNGFSTALDYVSNLIDNGMSDSLTIRPVLDLSEIQNGARSIGGIIGSANGYTISGTARLAASTAYGMRSSADVTTSPGINQTDVGPTTNNFYITNSDPDAVAKKVSKIIGQQTRRQKAVWAYNN